MSLPLVQTENDFRAINRSDPAFVNASREILKRANVPDANVAPVAAGSLPVLSIGDEFVIKFFPQPFLNGFRTECAAIEFLQSFDVPSPKLHLAGTFESCVHLTSEIDRNAGTSTPGYFSGGGLFLMDQPSDFMLYLCVNRGTLDGIRIEGVGVRPDVIVEFESDNDLGDSQLMAALKRLPSDRAEAR